jgi:CubicO group peptidase (beta-lactamase class C family)
VTGQPIQEYLRRTFLAPLGMAGSSLGLPRDQRDRAARIYSMGPEQRLAVFGFGLPHARSAVLPAASLNSTARDLAVFYQMLINGGLYAGRRNLAPETIAVATAVGYEGLDAKEGTPVRWAYGFHLGGLLPGSPYPGPEDGKGSTARTFGHNGQASCMVWADPDAQLVVAFLCNGLQNRAVVHARWAEISDAAWDALSR